MSAWLHVLQLFVAAPLSLCVSLSRITSLTLYSLSFCHLLAVLSSFLFSYSVYNVSFFFFFFDFTAFVSLCWPLCFHSAKFKLPLTEVTTSELCIKKFIFSKLLLSPFFTTNFKNFISSNYQRKRKYLCIRVKLILFLYFCFKNFKH